MSAEASTSTLAAPAASTAPDSARPVHLLVLIHGMWGNPIHLDEARRIIVRAALLDAERPGDVVEVVEQIGYLKIDPTATIAPCEHTMAWSRIAR